MQSSYSRKRAQYVSGALIVVGTVMYVVAWFLPTLNIRFGSLDGGTIPGWVALLYALQSFGGGFQMPWYLRVLYVASALSNTVTVGVLAVVFIVRHSPLRMLRAMLVASALLNTHWFVQSEYRHDLMIGYYLWASSFFVIAAGLVVESRRSGSHRSLGIGSVPDAQDDE